MRWAEIPSRDDVRELMSRPEFQYPKSVMERIGEWITRHLDRLVRRTPDPSLPSMGGVGAGTGSLIGWLLVIMALSLIVTVIVMVVRRWTPRVADGDDPLSDTELEHRRRAAAWVGDAERLEAEGEWKLAIRARYRALVRTLVDRRQVLDLAGRTTGELRIDMAESTPDAADAFDTACLLFELPWYGHVDTGADENRRFRDLADKILSAPVSRRVDQPVMAEPAVLISTTELEP